MGVAYFIELDNEEFDIDYSAGKSIATAMDDLNAIAQELGLKSLEEFMGQSMDDIGDMLGEEIEMEDGSDGSASWFEPKEGIAILEALVEALRSNPKRIKSSTSIVEDLENFATVLRVAQTRGAKWHLAIDI